MLCGSPGLMYFPMNVRPDRKSRVPIPQPGEHCVEQLATLRSLFAGTTECMSRVAVYIQAMYVIVVVITVANKVPCDGWLGLQESACCRQPGAACSMLIRVVCFCARHLLLCKNAMRCTPVAGSSTSSVEGHPASVIYPSLWFGLLLWFGRLLWFGWLVGVEAGMPSVPTAA